MVVDKKTDTFVYNYKSDFYIFGLDKSILEEIWREIKPLSIYDDHANVYFVSRLRLHFEKHDLTTIKSFIDKTYPSLLSDNPHNEILYDDLDNMENITTYLLKLRAEETEEKISDKVFSVLKNYNIEYLHYSQSRNPHYPILDYIYNTGLTYNSILAPGIIILTLADENTNLYVDDNKLYKYDNLVYL